MRGFLFLLLAAVALADLNLDFQDLDELEEEINKAMGLSQQIVQDEKLMDAEEGQDESAGTLIEEIDANYKSKKNQHQGDMLFTDREESQLAAGVQGDLVRNSAAHWTVTKDSNNRDEVLVPYTFAAGTSDKIKSVWQEAVEEYEQKTCIRFIPRNNEANFINVINDQGCYSYVGKVPVSQFPNGQPLSLLFRGLDQAGCHFKGIAVHEMMHALGYYHEQSRPDRDDYVTIKFENIRSGMESNFNKMNTNTQGTTYDFGSVMHYGRTAFSKNNQDTIVPKSQFGAQTLGQRNGLSVIDASSLNAIYCQDRVATTASTVASTQSTSTQATSSQASTSTQATSSQASTSTQATSSQASTSTQATSSQASTSTQATSSQASTSTQATSSQASTSTLSPTTTESTTTEAPATTEKPGISLPQNKRFCPRIAKAGFCRYCLLSDNCADCADKHNSCPRWAPTHCRRGRWRKWMRRNCAKSCNEEFGGCIA